MSTSPKGGYLGGSAEEPPVLRWLQLGAASACTGAALIGWSLVGSEAGVASADSSAGSSSSAGPAASHADTHARSATPRTVNRTVAAGDADAPPKVVSRSNRVAAAEISSVEGRLTNATNVNSRATSRAATQNGKPLSAAQKAVAPPLVTAASRSDPFGALGRFFTSTLKELFNRKTTLNPLQRLDDLTPKQKSLLDLIPKIPVRKEDALWYREIQAREAEKQGRANANARQIDEILQKGVKLTARDGMAVYTIDGRTFVRYSKVFANSPPQPSLVTLSNQLSDRNTDIVIRNSLKLDPAQVRSLWRK